jgi:hypothetical protein
LLAGNLPLHIDVDGTAQIVALQGTVTIAAQPQSFLAMAFGRLVTVILRESGF